MGLDMYLEAERYIGGWEHSPEPERTAYAIILTQLGVPPCGSSPSLTVSVNVAYWRKANAIHAWFVEHVQGGVDNCQRSHVDRDDLAQLVATCKEVLASCDTVPSKVDAGTRYTQDGSERLFRDGEVVVDPTVAIEKLPSQSGFFFGSTNYDDGYVADLRATIEQIQAVLNNPAFERCDFYYTASW
jgi:hypothetical protein